VVERKRYRRLRLRLPLPPVSPPRRVLGRSAGDSDSSQRYHEALKAKGVATEYHLLETGTHGGVAMDNKPAIRVSKEHFADAFLKWLKEKMKM